MENESFIKNPTYLTANFWIYIQTINTQYNWKVVRFYRFVIRERISILYIQKNVSPSFDMVFLYTKIASYMIYIQLQISCTLPLNNTKLLHIIVLEQGTQLQVNFTRLLYSSISKFYFVTNFSLTKRCHFYI